jgi:hypothetical protein
MKHNLQNNGYNTSVRVLSITQGGIMLEIKDNEFFLPYHRNPWFKNAKVSDVFNVAMYGKDTLRWDALDVDLEVDSLLYPEKYPLIAKQA